MQVTETNLDGVKVIQPVAFRDNRGSFFESFQMDRYEEVLGGPIHFVQDNFSFSKHGVLRGLHTQWFAHQAKLVSVIHGTVLDVIVDIDPESPTCGQHVTIELSCKNRRQIWIPPRKYAHGFCVISAEAVFHFKSTTFYAPQSEVGVRWNDPALGISWPDLQPIVSARDCLLPTLDELHRSGMLKKKFTEPTQS